MDQELKEHRRRPAVVLGSIVGIVAVVVVLYMLTLGRPVLVGEDRHDYGVILIPDGEEGAWAEHTFTLRNRTRQPLTIEQVHTSCGCTATRYAPHVVQPGENLEVRVMLTVSQNGLSEERAFVQTAERGMRTLTVRGVGRREQQLRTNRPGLHLRDDSEQTFVVFGDVWPDDLANGTIEPTLTVDGGDALNVRIAEWTEHRPANPRAHTPAIWSGQIVVRPADGALANEASDTIVTVTLLSKHTLELPVRLMAMPDQETPYQQNKHEHDPRQFNPLDFAPGN